MISTSLSLCIRSIVILSFGSASPPLKSNATRQEYSTTPVVVARRQVRKSEAVRSSCASCGYCYHLGAVACAWLQACTTAWNSAAPDADIVSR
ncbi:hypothetical protein C8J57DRAFT_106189 [Mycena rebaudengoi]|nr:hypothetical protein C8J57DRAFT_106189 [Mycena rebaudengoi]